MVRATYRSNFEIMCLHLVDRPDKISRYHVGAVVFYFFFIYGVYINLGVHWAFGVAVLPIAFTLFQFYVLEAIIVAVLDAICGKKKK